MPKKISRKQFMIYQGATCANWNWSWSFINEKDKVIITGTWEDYFDKENKKALIFSKDWEYRRGRKQSSYNQTREHLRLIEEEGYSLKTFLMKNSGKTGNGPRKIKHFEQVLHEKMLLRVGRDWYAVDDEYKLKYIPEELGTSAKYLEGTKTKIYVNSYERNKNARQKCLNHHGYKCKGCRFDFERTYGSMGAKYIHVHHLIPIHSIKKEYQIDPIKDLVPICPNCHAVIHRKNPPLTMDELRNLISDKI